MNGSTTEVGHHRESFLRVAYTERNLLVPVFSANANVT